MNPLDRREFLALGALARPLRSAEPDDPLWRDIVGRIEAADRKRSAQLASVRDASGLNRLRFHVRTRLLQGMGPFPVRTALNPRVTGTLHRDGYVIEKIVFESRSHYFVSANVYRPRKAGRYPAVLQSCGHYDEGKAAPDYQVACAGLARKGFV